MNSQIPYFKSWLIYTVSTLVLSALCGMAIGFVFGMILGIAGAPITTIKPVCGTAGFIAGVTASYAMFRWVVDRFIVPAIAESHINASSGTI